ncbi:hypothetical protein CsSME_00043864 [Camellia sinensis var. sinensis]
MPYFLLFTFPTFYICPSPFTNAVSLSLSPSLGLTYESLWSLNLVSLSLSLYLSFNLVLSLLDVLLRSAPLLCRYPSSSSGVSPEKGTGATISDDNDDQLYSDTNIFDGSFDEQQTRAETKLPRAALL